MLQGQSIILPVSSCVLVYPIIVVIKAGITEQQEGDSEPQKIAQVDSCHRAPILRLNTRAK